LAVREGVIAGLVGQIVVLEGVVRGFEALVLQLVDRMNVQGDVILQTASLGLAGKDGSSLGLEIIKMTITHYTKLKTIFNFCLWMRRLAFFS